MIGWFFAVVPAKKRNTSRRNRDERRRYLDTPLATGRLYHSVDGNVSEWRWWIRSFQFLGSSDFPRLGQFSAYASRYFLSAGGNDGCADVPCGRCPCGVVELTTDPAGPCLREVSLERGLTKILIVLQLVFSLVLSVVLVLMVSKMDPYKQGMPHTALFAATADKVRLQEEVAAANAAATAPTTGRRQKPRPDRRSGPRTPATPPPPI